MAARPNSLHTQISVARVMVALYTGSNIGPAVDTARRTLLTLPPADPFLRGLAIFVAGLAFYLGADVDAAQKAFDESAEFSQTTGNALVAQMAVYTAGYQQMLQGHLRRAAAIFESGVHAALPGGGQEPPPIVCVLCQALAEVLREQNDLDGAERYLAQAAVFGEQLGSAEMLIDGIITLARVRQARGNAAGASATLARALEFVRQGKVMGMTGRQVRAYAARPQIAQGRLPAAAGWAGALVEARAADRRQWPDMLVVILGGLEDNTLARLRLAEGRYADAAEILQSVLRRAKAAEHTGISLEALALLALAEDGAGDRTKALATLRACLVLAEPEGYARIFLDEGPAMAALLSRARAHDAALPGPLKAYVDQLLKAFPQPGAAVPAAAALARAGAVPGTN